MRLLLDRAIEVRRRNQLAEVGVTLIVLRQQRQPVDGLFAAQSQGAAQLPSIAPMIGCTPLPKQASLNGMAP